MSKANINFFGHRYDSKYFMYKYESDLGYDAWLWRTLVEKINDEKRFF